MIHAVAAVFTCATLLIVSAMWLLAEQRRAEAERRIDALLGVMAETLKHATIGAANFDKAASMVPQPAWLEPAFEEAQYGASRMRAIERTLSQAMLLTRGDQHGRERKQEDRV